MKSLLLLFLLILSLWMGCVTQEATTFESGINADTLQIPDTSITNRIGDTIYFISDSIPFADFPLSFRELHTNYCASCHSFLPLIFDSLTSITSPIINTWEQMLEYGVVKYYLAVRTGSMDSYLQIPVPDSIYVAINKFLAQAPSSGNLNTSIYIEGINDPEINRIAHTYCANCHGFNGSNFRRNDLSTYAKWLEKADDIIYIIEEDNSMPEKESRERTLWDQTPEDKQKLLDWLNGGLPNH